MGKKKVNIKFLFLILFILAIMDSHSQEIYGEKLHWKQKKEAVTELYESMQHSVVECNKSKFFNRIFKRQKIDKQLTLQKQIRQNETKNYLDSNFVFVNDSVVSFGFKNKIQIAEWGKNLKFSPFMPLSAVHSAEFCIKDINIIILRVIGCSGIPCISFYVFKEKGDIWELQTTSQARLKEQIIIRVDNDREKIIFRTQDAILSELPFTEILK